MSALSYLRDYGSNSEESDCEVEEPYHRPKLPVPNLSNISVVVPLDEHQDKPHLHGGRIRSFQHVRGNWATYVFLQYLDVEIINEYLNKLASILLSAVESCQRCDDFHISLSKTVVLKYHLISSFNTSLLKILKKIESIDLSFAGLKVYCNEEKSRTFIALEVDPYTQRFLLEITKKIDQVLIEYQCPTFYKDPSFHMSILWVNGNKKSELSDIVEYMNEILFQDFADILKIVKIDTVNCKIGKKVFRYPLS